MIVNMGQENYFDRASITINKADAFILYWAVFVHLIVVA